MQLNQEKDISVFSKISFWYYKLWKETVVMNFLILRFFFRDTWYVDSQSCMILTTNEYLKYST